MEITKATAADVVSAKLKSEWCRFESDLREWKQAYHNIINKLAHDYRIALLESIDERYPDTTVLNVFGIFNPALIPENEEQRQEYGKEELEIDNGSLRRLQLDWPGFFERYYITLVYFYCKLYQLKKHNKLNEQTRTL